MHAERAVSEAAHELGRRDCNETDVALDSSAQAATVASMATAGTAISIPSTAGTAASVPGRVSVSPFLPAASTTVYAVQSVGYSNMESVVSVPIS